MSKDISPVVITILKVQLFTLIIFIIIGLLLLSIKGPIYDFISNLSPTSRPELVRFNFVFKRIVLVTIGLEFFLILLLQKLRSNR